MIERAVILSRGKVLRLDLAMADILEAAPQRAETANVTVKGEEIMTDEALRELERKNMLAALQLADWRVSGPNGAARLLGVKPTTLADRMRKFRISRPRRARA